VRYSLPVTPGGFRIAPQIGFTYPTDYPVPFAFHGAYGQKLKQLHLGLNVGRGITERSFFDLSYQFTFSELPDEHPFDDPTLPTLDEIGVGAPHRHDLRLDAGYFVLDQLLLQLGAHGRYTHGGFDWKEYASWDLDFNNWTPEQISKDAQHDRVAKEKYVILHVGAAYAIMEELNIFADFQRLLVGANVGGLPYGFSVGLAGAYTFL